MPRTYRHIIVTDVSVMQDNWENDVRAAVGDDEDRVSEMVEALIEIVANACNSPDGDDQGELVLVRRPTPLDGWDNLGWCAPDDVDVAASEIVIAGPFTYHAKMNDGSEIEEI